MLRFGSAVAALMLTTAVACGSTSATPTPSHFPTATAVETLTAAPTPDVAHDVVYFARDRLPPVGAHVPSAGSGATPQMRVRSRLDALFTAIAPVGTFNVVRAVRARPTIVSVIGDLATVDFHVLNDDWGIAGSAGTRAFVQQIIYTASEEPGVRRVLMTQNGGKRAIVGGEGLVIDHAATREDVAGYVVRSSLEPVRSFEGEVPPVVPAAAISSRYSVDAVAPGLARVVVELARSDGAEWWLPAFEVRVAPDQTALGGKAELLLTVFDGNDRVSDTAVDRTPLRRLRIESPSDAQGTLYRLVLDDLRPWRVGLMFDPVRIVLDVGGDPDAVNSNVAVYQPRFGATLRRGATVSGMTRAFEATYEYRLTDLFGRVLASGHGTASFGTSPIWGVFDVALDEIPPNAANVEVLLRSPRDGEITDLVTIPIAVER